MTVNREPLKSSGVWLPFMMGEGSAIIFGKSER